MIASQRYETIVELVNKTGIVNTKDLAVLMNVTETTIRRDCEELEKAGKLIRVHGGAKSVKQKVILSNRDEKKMRDRTDNYEEKCKVCEKAASFVKEGDCVFLDGGTTVVPMVKYLHGKKVKIVTHSHLIAEVFQDTDSEVFIIGGKYIPEYNMDIGPIALGNLSRFNFDCAFLGCAGYDLEKQVVYTTELDTMMIKEKAMELSVKSYLLMDSSKLNIRGFYSFVGQDAFDAVICNDCEKFEKEEMPDNFIVV